MPPMIPMEVPKPAPVNWAKRLGAAVQRAMKRLIAMTRMFLSLMHVVPPIRTESTCGVLQKKPILASIGQLLRKRTIFG